MNLGSRVQLQQQILYCDHTRRRGVSKAEGFESAGWSKTTVVSVHWLAWLPKRPCGGMALTQRRVPECTPKEPSDRQQRWWPRHSPRPSCVAAHVHCTPCCLSKLLHRAALVPVDRKQRGDSRGWMRHTRQPWVTALAEPSARQHYCESLFGMCAWGH